MAYRYRGRNSSITRRGLLARKDGQYFPQYRGNLVAHESRSNADTLDTREV